MIAQVGQQSQEAFAHPACRRVREERCVTHTRSWSAVLHAPSYARPCGLGRRRAVKEGRTNGSHRA